MISMKVYADVPEGDIDHAIEDDKHTVLRIPSGSCNGADIAVSGDGTLALYCWRGDAGWRQLPRAASLASSVGIYRFIMGKPRGLTERKLIAVSESNTIQCFGEGMEY